MNVIASNLARKLRSQDFNQIIGQDLTIKILKNSLYKSHYFPVYLFAGQRGCGKTTTARVFAAALNCQELSLFQKNPKKLVPCLVCASCLAMKVNKHPDFIEIDAASHTGVDNIRQIIESTTLLPLMGHKKIYLIDEAHMLSKSAFNALLKILEEPPPSVLFILATTMPLKIIETVRSRCFQLFFRSIKTEILFNYLKKICKQEKIGYEESGLLLIINQSEGSVRDALNLLEQVRFLGKIVNKELVLKTLGYVDDSKLIFLLDTIFQRQPLQLLQAFKAIQEEKQSAEFIWYRLIELLRLLLWINYGVEPTQATDNLKLLAQKNSLIDIHQLLETLYNYESIFIKTTAQHALLETVLLQFCQQYKKNNDNNGSSSLPQQQFASSQEELSQEKKEMDNIDEDEENEKNEEYIEQWALFLQTIETLDDSLIISVFKQGRLVQFDKNTEQLTIEFHKELIFFNDWLEETNSLWLPLLQKAFTKNIKLKPIFTGTKKIEMISINSKEQKNSLYKRQMIKHTNTKKITSISKFQKSQKLAQEAVIDISDKNQWKKTHLILRYFPSKVTEVRK
ncbi:MAG: DNA polymerase III subunit gamma/tau [Candidatus Babeliales bacterium]